MERPLVPSFSGVHCPEELKGRLREMISRGAVPHALLLSGKPGSEALALALATAKRILCTRPTPEGDACGECLSCRQAATLENPDLTLVFPIAKEGDSKEVVSAMSMPLFREMMRKYPRFTDHEWKEIQDSGNRQLSIMVAEAERMIEKTALKSFNSDRQVVVIWLPETMRTDAANKLLKLFEEPPEGILFIAVTNNPDALLPTILSRFQRVRVPPIEEPVLLDVLTRDYDIPASRAREAAHLASGNLYTALKLSGAFGEKEARDEVLEEAVRVFETAYSRRPELYLAYAEKLSKESRPFVLEVTDKLLSVIREASALRVDKEGDFVYIPAELGERIGRISERLPESAYPVLMEEIAQARQELRQNANVKILYFDLLIRLARLAAR